MKLIASQNERLLPCPNLTRLLRTLSSRAPTIKLVLLRPPLEGRDPNKRHVSISNKGRLPRKRKLWSRTPPKFYHPGRIGVTGAAAFRNYVNGQAICRDGESRPRVRFLGLPEETLKAKTPHPFESGYEKFKHRKPAVSCLAPQAVQGTQFAPNKTAKAKISKSATKEECVSTTASKKD